MEEKLSIQITDLSHGVELLKEWLTPNKPGVVFR